MNAFLFWSSLLFIVFTYAGYPFVLSRLPRIRSHLKRRQKSASPAVSVVISARNEAAHIERRLRNLLEQEYPGPLEILLVSDGSTDMTVTLAKQLNDELAAAGINLVLIEKPHSEGKPVAINQAVKKASGELLLFADARQWFAPGAIAQLAGRFADPEVGAVSGALVFVSADDPGLEMEMSAYWEYEKKIRRMESDTGSVMGTTGAIYALRRSDFEPIPPYTLLDDVLIPLRTCCRGRRVLFDQDAVAYDCVSREVDEEWERKVRTLTGNWQLLFEFGMLRQSLRHGFFFRLFWHKTARLLVPLLLALMPGFCFSAGGWYTLVGSALLGGFFLAWLMAYLPLLRRSKLLKLWYFFCVLNLAAVYGFFTWITGGSSSAWKEH